MTQEDISGLDTIIRVSKGLYPGLCNAKEPLPYLKKLVKKGELGLKTGKGHFNWRGKTRIEVLEERDRNLLQQRILFKQREG